VCWAFATIELVPQILTARPAVPASVHSGPIDALVASALGKIYPGKFETPKMVELVGNAATIKQLVDVKDPAAIVAGWDKDLDAFRKVRAKYLLYE